MIRSSIPLLAMLLGACGSDPVVRGPAVTDAPVEADEPAEPAVEPLSVSEQQPHVVMITLDTFRGDRLGANGYAKAQTETLDALANAGVRFSRAYSPLPLTIPSHSSMFTGKNPPTLGIRDNGHGVLGEEQVTLTEVLQSKGYATAGSVAAFVTTRTWGFSQGFDAFFDEIPAAKDDNFWHGERRGDLVIDDALGWKAEQDPERALFLWVHLYDAHFPFAPPEEYRERTKGRPYDAEIAFVDDQVERLVQAFKGSPTLFVVLGDHGEGLGEHGELNHGMFAYDATQHVPFFIAGPGVEPRVVDTPVSVVDLMPTVLGQLGIEAPEGIEGRDAMSSDPRPVYLETYQLSERFRLAPHIAVVDGNLKLIDTPKPELYDLSADAKETVNLASARPEDVERLRKILEGFGYEAPGEATEPIDPAVRAQLEALGYVDGAEMPAFDGDLPDPKDHSDLVRLSQRADREHMTRQVEASVKTLATLTERYPAIIEFRTRRATMLRKLGRAEEARTEVEAAFEQAPENTNLRAMVAGYKAEDGDFAAAAAEFQAIAIAVPFMPRVRSLAVMAVKQTGDIKAAIDLGLRYHEEHPEDDAITGTLGVLLVETGEMEMGMGLLEQAWESEQCEADVGYYLGARAVGRGNLDDARKYLEGEAEGFPGNMRALFALMNVYKAQQEWDKQLEVADKMLAIAPNDPNSLHGKVLALFNLERYDEARVAVDAGRAIDPGHPHLMLMDANLLAQEGEMDKGKVRFAEAQAALREREEAVQEAVSKMQAGGNPFEGPAFDRALEKMAPAPKK